MLEQAGAYRCTNRSLLRGSLPPSTCVCCRVCYPETPNHKRTLVLGWDMEFLSGHDAATEVKAMLR